MGRVSGRAAFFSSGLFGRGSWLEERLSTTSCRQELYYIGSGNKGQNSLLEVISTSSATFWVTAWWRLPMAAPAGPLAQVAPPHEFGLPVVPTDGTPFGMRSGGSGESVEYR